MTRRWTRADQGPPHNEASGYIPPLPAFTSTRSLTVAGSRIFMVRLDEDMPFAGIVGRDVEIDGALYHVTGVSTRRPLRKGDEIALIVRGE